MCKTRARVAKILNEYDLTATQNWLGGSDGAMVCMQLLILLYLYILLLVLDILETDTRGGAWWRNQGIVHNESAK